jgi:hypothetical protein
MTEMYDINKIDINNLYFYTTSYREFITVDGDYLILFCPYHIKIWSIHNILNSIEGEYRIKGFYEMIISSDNYDHFLIKEIDLRDNIDLNVKTPYELFSSIQSIQILKLKYGEDFLYNRSTYINMRNVFNANLLATIRDIKINKLIT